MGLGVEAPTELASEEIRTLVEKMEEAVSEVLTLKNSGRDITKAALRSTPTENLLLVRQIFSPYTGSGRKATSEEKVQMALPLLYHPLMVVEHGKNALSKCQGSMMDAVLSIYIEKFNTISGTGVA